MLTTEDLNAIKELMAAQEERIYTRMDARLAAQEERIYTRMDARLAAQEERIKTELRAEIIHDVNLIVDMQITPKLELLAEGHQMLHDLITPKERIEELENEVKFLKNVLSDAITRIKVLEQKTA